MELSFELLSPVLSPLLSPILAAADTATNTGFDWSLFSTMAFNVIGGLAIFLLGMKHMSEGMQAVAGNGLRRMIGLATDNRLMATGVGTGVTCLVQSSSITTVLVVGFVNSGLMVLHQAVGVIMGANIGTTITGWILVLKIGKYGLPILGVAAFIYMFTKRERLRYLAMAVMGLGMVFFGLMLMKNGFGPIKEFPAFESWFRAFTADNYWGVLKCAMAGCILTMIVQSSSATLGITIGLATTGVISFPTAAALVLGENIGTTITALLASLGTTTNAKRAAYFHAIFNVIGVLWVTAIFTFFYLPLIDQIVEWIKGMAPLSIDMGEISNLNSLKVSSTITAEQATRLLKLTTIVTFGIATVHTCFNVTNTLLFMPFCKYIADLLTKYIPDKSDKEQPHLTTLEMHLINTPVMGIEQSRGQILKMGEGCDKMLNWSMELLQQIPVDQQMSDKFFHREEVLDAIEKEVVTFLTELLATNVPLSIAEEGRIQLRVADEYESMSDAIISIVKAHMKLNRKEKQFTDSQLEQIQLLNKDVLEYLEMINQSFVDRKPETVTKAHAQGSRLTRQIKQYRKKYLSEMSETRFDPEISMSYMTVLAQYRNVKEHALNIAEALAGEK